MKISISDVFREVEKIGDYVLVNECKATWDGDRQPRLIWNESKEKPEFLATVESVVTINDYTTNRLKSCGFSMCIRQGKRHITCSSVNAGRWVMIAIFAWKNKNPHEWEGMVAHLSGLERSILGEVVESFAGINVGLLLGDTDRRTGASDE